MWILFSLLCMIFLTASEITGKKAVDHDALATVKLRISAMSVSVILSIVLYALGLGESGHAPWVILTEYPLIPAAMCCTVLSDFLYMLSLRYVGLTVMEALSSMESVAIFAGLVCIHLVSGRLGAINDMLHPVKLILIGILLFFTCLLPNVEIIANRKTDRTEKQIKEKRSKVAGMLLALLAVIFSSLDSVIGDAVLDSGDIGTADFTIAVFFSSILLLPAFCAVLFSRRKQTKSGGTGIGRYSALYTALFVVQLFFGILAVSVDAVRSEIMYLSYPVISVLGAKTILKEKYTWKQNICIWVITLAAIGFCVTDYFII